MKIEPNSYLRFSDVINDRRNNFIYFDTPNLPRVREQDDDVDYIIDQKYHRRPDKLAEDLYDDHNLWWVIALRNNWDHPQIDCFAGRKIKISSKRYVVESLIA